MIWEDKFLEYIKYLEKEKPVIICGDLNVAHTEIDIKNAKANIGNAGFTYEEREKFNNLLNHGLIDTWRYLNKDIKINIHGGVIWAEPEKIILVGELIIF